MISWFENHLIFFPTKSWEAHPEAYRLQYENLTFKTEDEISLSGWFFPAKKQSPIILFLHGNAGNISHRLDKIRPFVERGYAVFIIDYRGFGKSEGSVSEEGTYKDARAAYEYLNKVKNIPPDQIVAYGESIGSAVAVDLATRVSLAGLILEAPFTQISDMAKTHYPFIPTKILKTRYDSLSKISSVQTPLLILHGTDDEIVPFRLGQKLFEAANEPKAFYAISGGTHNESFFIGGKEFWDVIFDFLGRREKN